MALEKETSRNEEENSVIKSSTESQIPEHEIEEVVDELKKNPKLKDLSEEQLKAIAEISIVEVRQESMFSGPLPHPAILEGYEKLYQVQRIEYSKWLKQMLPTGI